VTISFPDNGKCQASVDGEDCSNEQQWKLVYKQFDSPFMCICDSCFSQLDPEFQLSFEPIL
jgi:hypothetical protein